MTCNDPKNRASSALQCELKSESMLNEGPADWSHHSPATAEARIGSFAMKMRDLIAARPAQVASLALPLIAHLFVVTQANNLDILAVVCLVTPMVAYLACQFLRGRYVPENFALIFGGACALSVFLSTRTLPVLNPQQFYSAIPAGWAFLFSVIFLNSRGRDGSPCRAPLLFAAALVGIAICLVIWYAGGKNCVLLKPMLAYGGTDRFPYTFTIWETQPISTHYFLTFDKGYASFESGNSYRGYTPLYTLLNYLPLRFLRAYTGLEYTNLMRVTPFLMGACGAFFIPASIIWAFPCPPHSRARFLFMTITSTAFLLLIPDLWTGPLLGRPDTAFPITAFFMMLLSTALMMASATKSSRERVVTVGLLAILGLALPHFGLVFAITLLLYWPAANRRFFLWSGVFTLVTSGLSLLSLSLLANLAGLSVLGSPILSRMGFTEHYLYSIVTAITAPTQQMSYRPWSFVLMGAAIGMIAIAAQAALCRSHKAATLSFLILAPAIMMVIIFPQSVSIHPELYDISLAVGGSAALFFTMFAILEEERFAAHRFLPWLVIFLSGCMFENARKLAIALLKF